MERIEIAPGAHITVLNAQQFNRCRISINFIWPATRERSTAEAVLPLVLERGYGDCPDMTELSKKLARLYGAALSVDSTISGQSRVLTVSMAGIKDRFALENESLSSEYAEIAFGTAFRPYLVDGVFDAEAVAIEKEQLRELLEGEMNEKRSYCIRQARRRLYGDSPAGIERNGYLNELDDITPADIKEAYDHMLETAQVEVFVLGADVDAVREKLLEALKNRTRSPKEPPAAIAFPAKEMRSYTETMPTVQGKLCMMFTPDEPFSQDDLSALRIAVAIFGGLPTSRLFQNVREKQGLCYYCAASFTSLTNVLCVDSGVEHDKAEATKQAVLKELEALCTGGATPKELDDAKRALKNSLAAVGDTLHGRESWYFAELMRNSQKSPKQVEAEVDAVTAADVQRVLSRFRPAVCYTLTKEAENHE